MNYKIHILIIVLVLLSGCTSVASPFAPPKDPIIGHWGTMDGDDGKTYHYFAFGDKYTGTEITKSIWYHDQNDFKWKPEDNGTYTLFYYHKIIYVNAIVNGDTLTVWGREYKRGFKAEPG